MIDWDKIDSFKKSEFECKCGCGLYNMNDQMIGALVMARKNSAVPFVITSGSRCEKHNAHVGGKKASSHLTGYAADISCPDSATRMALLRALIRFFPRIEVGDDWIHVDIDPTKSQNVCWLG